MTGAGMAGVGIIGASGYTGFELIKILESHPHAELKVANANTHAGKKISSLYPEYRGERECFDGFQIDEIVRMKLDCVFLALPNGLAMKMAPKFLESGTRVVDLSADYRFREPAAFEQVYRIKHEDAERKAAYGLPELFRDEIRAARIVANPGCYATVSALAAYPLVEAGLAESMIFDAKSGYSGAGREKTETEEYQIKIRDNLIAYNIVAHRHLPEIRQFLGHAVSFTPHVMPHFRGMMSTAHVMMKAQQKQMARDEIAELYKKRYANEPFVKVMEAPPDLHEVQNNNYCVLGGFESDDRGRAVIVGVIDNLLKGASGQAVQNMNIMLGFGEKEGLE